MNVLCITAGKLAQNVDIFWISTIIKVAMLFPLSSVCGVEHDIQYNTNKSIL